MKYKKGDKVQVKSLDWYNQMLSIPSKIVGKGDFVAIECGTHIFTKYMCKFCGMVMTIQDIGIDFYLMEEDNLGYEFTDEMIEGLVEEETNDCEKCGLIRNSTKCLFMDNCPHNKQKNIIEIPESYVLKDENGNVINATKIVFEKKKKEYPNTYVECSDILSVYTDPDIDGYKGELLWTFQKLLICRDAYWKIAGEEIGLGKPWEPDWNNPHTTKWTIVTGEKVRIVRGNTRSYHSTFAFPTSEMRDAFYENFKKEIEMCKELL